MRTNFVLIDFENVKPKSLNGLGADHFEVLMFVGANQSKVPFELVTAMQEKGEKARYVKISGNGSNALDFHIAFYIGQLAAKCPEAYFHIISGDSGFDPLIAHLKSKQIFCCRSAAIHNIPLVKAGAPMSAEERARHVISKLELPKATRPRTPTTLSRAISACFQNQINEDEIASVLKVMQDLKFLTLADGKIAYAKTGE